MEQQPDQDAPQRFTEWFALWSHGQMDVEAQRAFSKVVSAVLFTEKPGTVTLQFRVEKMGSNAVAMSPRITAKAPESPDVAVFYDNGRGGLSKQDPMAPSFATLDAGYEEPVMTIDADGRLRQVPSGDSGEV